MRANLGFDWFFIGYCLMSLTIAIICDAEAVLHDPATYGKVEPLVNWPPQAVVLALHDWCRRFDPLLGARPLWFLVCFYMEMTLQVPYYIAATYAFLHGCEWIRVPTLAHAIVLVEQFFGEFATPAPLVILGSYLPFAIAPVFFLYRARGTTMFAAKTKQA